jgi:hypothetical protein
MKKIAIAISLLFLITGLFAQNNFQVIVDISAPSCCPTFGEQSATYGVHGWKESSPADYVWEQYNGPGGYTLTFGYAFPQSQANAIMTHVWCRTAGAKGICGYMSGQMVTCKDESVHEVYTGDPDTQQFSLQLVPSPEATPGGDPPPED